MAAAAQKPGCLLPLQLVTMGELSVTAHFFVAVSGSNATTWPLNAVVKTSMSLAIIACV